jgi:hypothetical protein
LIRALDKKDKVQEDRTFEVALKGDGQIPALIFVQFVELKAKNRGIIF